jgi:AcrR family transcriptional regulator
VPALAPEDRRATLIEATLPLLRECGVNVSTRQIADAAGVAEGTIFGVFPDKASLLRATVVRAMDPEDAIAAIGAIDRSLDLRDRLTAAAEILNERMAEKLALMTMFFRSGQFELPGDVDLSHSAPVEVREAKERVVDAVVAIIGPDAARLRQSPGVTAGLLVSLIFVAAHGGFGFTETISAPAEIVSLLLDGLLYPAGQTAHSTGDTTCSSSF